MEQSEVVQDQLPFGQRSGERVALGGDEQPVTLADVGTPAVDGIVEVVPIAVLAYRFYA